MRFYFGYFLLRLKQIARMVSGVGIFHFLVLTGVVVLLIVGIIKVSLNPEYQLAVSVASVLAIISLHLRRKDLGFIRTYSEKPFLIHFAEYVLLTLPLSIPLIITKQYLLWMGYLTVILGLSSLRPVFKRQNLNTKIQSWIPARAFEWKSGIRKTFYPFLVVWLLGFLFSFLEASVPIAIFILGILIFSFYENGEPLDMLLAFEIRPSKLLLLKVKYHFILFLGLCLPLLLIFVVQHHSIWYIPIIILLLMGFGHLYLILLKYAWYSPAAKPAGIEILTSLAFIAIIIPVFMPVIWLLSIRFYFKAIKTLKPYLNDFD